MSRDGGSNDPRWLSEEHDELQREEGQPLLFGSGKISLQDPEQGALKPPQPSDDTDHGPFGANYGATNSEDVATTKSVPRAEKRVSRSTSASSKQSDKPHNPGQNACLWTFHLFSGTSAMASFCLLVTQILPFFIVPTKNIPQEIGVLSMALKGYISVFCLLFILVEAELPIPLVRRSALLQTYASRGFLYSFVALVCVQESYSERVKDIVKHGKEDVFYEGWVAIFMQISSWIMLGVGALYMLLGACWMKRLKDRLKQKEKDDWAEYRKAMKEWKETHNE